MTAGCVLGIASTIVMPPASAAAVPLANVSLCGAPGSRRCTCTSMKPGSLVIRRPAMQSVCVFIGGAWPISRIASTNSFVHLTSVISGIE
uniref:Putative secreted protein n=1 Tax=Anopheles marajoara TaxID=58244 RepID=A0A2M4CA19_9DIPT